MGKTISNPKVFTLDNQVATVHKVKYHIKLLPKEQLQLLSKEAALKLEVTPSIIGDGNVLLTIQVNNDTPNRAAGSDEPQSIKWKLLLNY